jgi:predicted Zn-dependent protease
MSSFPFGRQRQGPRRGFRLAPLLLGLIALGGFWVYSCQEGPFGRRQHIVMGVPDEMRLGAQAFQQTLAETEVERDPAVNEAVTRVCRNLVAAATDPTFLERVKIPKYEFEWQWRVVRSQQVNAFCLPGGKMVVYTGILPVCETEAGLAVVMGHEISHALCRHGAERMAQQQMVNIGQLATVGSISDMDPQAQRAVMTAFGMGAKYGVLLPYGRGHESEADKMGLYLMSIAGYDPANAPLFWERMTRATGGKGQPPEFASTHPGHERRVADLQVLQNEVRPLYEASDKQRDGDRRLPLGESRRP